MRQRSEQLQSIGKARIMTMRKSEKPPVGIVPAAIVSRARIQDLAAAIERYAGNYDTSIRHIKKWASEILKHVEIIEGESEDNNNE